MDFITLETKLEENIFIISINRPEKMNALNKTVIQELSQAIDFVLSNENIKSAIITGVGLKAFVAGADISEFTSLAAEAGSELAKKGQDMVFNKIENAPKPIIAAVNGFALGGGCELAMACHFRVCSPNAKFGQPEVNLGLIPGYGGTQRLPKLVGKGKAMEWMMTGALISAEEALQYGLVNYVVEQENLIEKTKGLLKTIHSKAPLAVASIISLTNMAFDDSKTGLETEIMAFGKLFDTIDAKEGISAFLEKRKPDFSGK